MRNQSLERKLKKAKRGSRLAHESEERENTDPSQASRGRVMVLTRSLLWCILPVWVVPSRGSTALVQTVTVMYVEGNSALAPRRETTSHLSAAWKPIGRAICVH